MRDRLVAIAVVSLAMSVLACGRATDEGSNRDGWPPFTASYHETRIEGNKTVETEFTVDYESDQLWMVQTVQHPGVPGLPGFTLIMKWDGSALRLEEPVGVRTLEADEYFDSQDSLSPFPEPWALPVAGRGELLELGWEERDDGNLHLEKSYDLTCPRVEASWECPLGKSSVAVVEEITRSPDGIPISFSYTVDGVVLQTVKTDSVRLTGTE